MIIVDFSHLANRNLFVAINTIKPKKINGKFDMTKVMPFFYHLMLNSLIHIRKLKPDDEIILAIDDRHYWRKEYYPLYKAQRKGIREESEIDFNVFFEKLNKFVELLDKCFPYYVIKVENAEADDIIGVLSKQFKNKVIIVTSDKDMKQALLYGAKVYDPIKKEYLSLKDDEVKIFKELHYLLGDKSDNIPNVMEESEFTNEFINYLANNKIYKTKTYEVESLDIFEKLKQEFKEKYPDKDIYKKPRFGEKTALKYINKLDDLFSKNKKIENNYIRNKKLINFDEIPNDIVEKIIDEYKNRQLNYNGDCIFKFLTKFNLRQHIMNMNEFTLLANNKKENEFFDF